MKVLVQYIILYWLFGGELRHIMSLCNNFQIVRSSFIFVLSSIDSLSFGLTNFPQYKSSTWSCADIGYLNAQAIFGFLLALLTFKVPMIWFSFTWRIGLTPCSHLGHKMFIYFRFSRSLGRFLTRISLLYFLGASSTRKTEIWHFKL